MTSSISSSDEGWRRWLVAFFGAPALGALLLLLLMAAVDPYDSGKLGWLGIEGVDDSNPRWANVSRARDPQFDSAVLGNSTGMILNPLTLSRETGTRFVMLTAAGLDPREQLAKLDFFMRQHRRIGALVMIIDAAWCTHDSDLPKRVSFPFWLYGENTLDYTFHLFSWRAVERSVQRLAIGLGLKPRDNPDGSTDYEIIWPPGKFNEVNPPQDPAPATSAAAREQFPAIDRLALAIKKIPIDTPLVLVVPPTFHTVVPRPGTIAAAEHAACMIAVRRTIAGRPRSNLLNYRVDNALTRDPANFADFVHYRAIIARRIEQGIIASIHHGAMASIDF